MTSALASGARIAHYRIGVKLGAGGMGEVYAAEDTRLGRQVAVKVLPPEVAGDAERRGRFEREAKAVAALNHPNIVTVHTVEEAEGQLLLVMERVQGKTIAELLPASGFPFEELVRIAVPLADAVGAAHERGITHRDLKPQNVMVTDAGRVKVLDFGLAKAIEREGAALAGADVATATAEGKIVGTAAYMSPEQAQGKRVDHRTDVFSLGVMLFEMATGRRPFGGESSITVITSILRDPAPEVSERNPAMPRGLSRIVRRCLAKEPGQRYQSAIDLRNDLDELQTETRSGTAAAAGAPAARSGRRRWLIVPGALAALAAAVLVGRWSARAGGAATAQAGPGPSPSPSPSPSIDRLRLLTIDEGVKLFPTLSPDGTWFAYAFRGPRGGWDIRRQRVGGDNAQNLTADCPEDDIEPAVSPDGEQIAFRSERGGGGLFVMGATGESVRRVTDVGYHPAWSPDGKQLAYSTNPVEDPKILRNALSDVWVVTVATGERRRLVERGSVQPAFSPHGTRVAYWAIRKGGVRDLATVPVGGGAPVWLTDDPPLDWNPVWSPDGRYLYFSSDRGGTPNLWRMAIDEASGKALGAPEPVTNGAGNWSYSLSFSRDGGRAVLDSGSFRSVTERVPFDAAKETAGPGERVVAGDQPAVWGEQLVFRVTFPLEDLVIMRTDGSGRRKLTDDGHRDRLPVWSPDGREISFKSDRGGSYQCWVIRPDGSGLRQVSAATAPVNLCFWRDTRHLSAGIDDGTTLTYDLDRPAGGQKPEETPRPEGERIFQAWAWSPDGKSLFGSAALPSGADVGMWVLEIESRRFTQLAETGGGAGWLSDGRRLLYGRDGELWLIDRATRRMHAVVREPTHSVDNFSLSPDQRWIYYQRQVVDGEVWLATFK